MKINSKSELEAAIIELEKRKQLQESLLIAQFKATRESLRPVNLIKNSFKKLTQAPDIKHDVLNNVAGIGAAILSKKLFIGRSSSIIKKLLSIPLELIVAKTTINNADKIKAYGISIYNNLFRKNNHHSDKEMNQP